MGFWAQVGEWFSGTDTSRRSHTPRHNGRQAPMTRSRGYNQAHRQGPAPQPARNRIATRSTTPRGDLARNKAGVNLAGMWFNRPQRPDARGHRYSDAT